MSKYDDIKKIVEDKLINKTEQRSYEELSEHLFGEGNCFAESEVRKRMYGMKRLIEIIDEDTVDQAKLSDKLGAMIKKNEETRRELEKERQKLFATKLEYNRDLRHDTRFELFYENIKNIIPVLEPPKMEVLHEAFMPDDRPKEYVLAFGDIHYGAKFVSENNKYSRGICKSRFDHMLHKVVGFVLDNNIQHITAINVADSIQGILRMSDLQLNDTDVVQCVVEISQIISEFLNSLSAYCYIDYYHITHSNHSQNRNLGSKASELAGEDMEKIIANYIADTLAMNDRVNVFFDLGKEYIDFDIFDFHCCAEHGHKVANIANYIRDKSNVRRKMYSYAFLGHTHASQEIIAGEDKNSNIEVLVVPSFIGSDPYSDRLNLGAKAMAKIYGFDPVTGHVESHNIILN